MTAFHDVMAYNLLTATEHVSGIKCNDQRKESHSFSTLRQISSTEPYNSVQQLLVRWKCNSTSVQDMGPTFSTNSKLTTRLPLTLIWACSGR